jgi:hypothetical protein
MTTNNQIEQFDFSVNLLKSLLWQYNKAPNLQGILEAKQSWYDANQRDFWSNWFSNVFNLETANEFGCNVWAIILGLPTTLITDPLPNAITPFGFDVTNKSNFGSSNFSSTGTSQIGFTLAEKRLLLRLRYRKLTARGVIPETNQILKDLIVPTYGSCYMLDGLNMTQRLVCGFSIPSALNIILTEYDLLPRPAGVDQSIVDTTFPVFGFGPTNENFGNGGFSPYE